MSYDVVFEFPDPYSDLTCDVLVHLATVELALRHNVHGTQTQENVIAFDSARDQTVALLRLSGCDKYTVKPRV